MSSPPAPLVVTPEAEAARYALLRRIAPSMRHHLVVHLQPIGMIYEVMDRRLRAPTPDLASVQDSAGKINSFARSALTACVDVVGWIQTDDTVAVAVPDVARECATLLATSMSFRGYALRNEVGTLGGTVRRSAIRHLLAASLLHASDHHPEPADLVLGAEAEAGAACLRITVRPTQGDAAMSMETNYRRITWSDLEALAVVDGVQLAREGEAIVLRFPWVAAP